MFLDRLGIPQFFTSISCVLLSFAIKPHLPLTGQIRNMAQIASMTGAMGHLSLYRSCRPVRMGPSNGSISRTCMRASDSYHVEIVLGETEPEDSAMRRFRRAVMGSNVIQEARRRRKFEDTQDIKKRKMRERGQWKKRTWKLETYDDVQGEEPAPFADLFGEDDFYGEGDVETLLSNGNKRRPVGGFKPRTGGQNMPNF